MKRRMKIGKIRICRRIIGLFSRGYQQSVNSTELILVVSFLWSGALDDNCDPMLGLLSFVAVHPVMLSIYISSHSEDF
jgi:hypothetical protein